MNKPRSLSDFSSRSSLGLASSPSRFGFSMIEAIVVVGIVIILTSITVPGSVSALRSGRVNQGVSILDTANADAQRFARRNQQDVGSEWYGVRLRGGQPPHSISVIRGSTASAPALEGLRKELNRGVLIYDGDSPLSGDLVWFYQSGTGFPVSAANPLGPTIAIGTPESPLSTDLSIRSNDGMLITRCQIFEVGLFNHQALAQP